MGASGDCNLFLIPPAVPATLVAPFGVTVTVVPTVAGCPLPSNVVTTSLQPGASTTCFFTKNKYLKRWSDANLPRVERIMQRHGGKTVFFGRFVAILRFTAAWIAGLARMHWWKFLFWNALGGIAWAASVGLAAYLLGHLAETIFRTFGLVGLAIVVLAAAAGWLVHRRRSRRRSRSGDTRG